MIHSFWEGLKDESLHRNKTYRLKGCNLTSDLGYFRRKLHPYRTMTWSRRGTVLSSFAHGWAVLIVLWEGTGLSWCLGENKRMLDKECIAGAI